MKDNQHEQLFQELSNEVAAICTGGAAYLYKDDGFKGRVLTFTEGTDDLHWYGFNDETSSIQITGTTPWIFYQDTYNRGKAVVLDPGSYNKYQLAQLGIKNDSISSLIRADLDPTGVLV